MLLSFLRTILLYLVLILAVRLMGKRQIGQMEASEFVVTMLVANLAAIPMQDGAIPLYTGLVPILTVLGMELVLCWGILKSVLWRRLLCGKPVILIDNGKILQENLRSTRVTLEELRGLLRQKDVLDITGVQYAILETDGNLSVFPYGEKEQQLPVTVISDGHLFRENLEKSGKNTQWLQRYLGKKRVGIRDTLLLTVAGETVVWIRKEAP